MAPSGFASTAGTGIMVAMTATQRPQSPCISICTLDDQDVCLGCLRTLDEIIDWTMLDDAAKRAVLERVAARSQQREQAG